MQVVSFYDRTTGTFSYLMGDRDSREAVIVDPVLGFDAASGRTDRTGADRLLEVADELGWTPRWILETHAHADHLSAAAYLKERSGAPIAIGAGICQVQHRFRGIYHLPDDFPVDGRQFDRLLSEGDELELGEQAIRVLETPGHTSDSLSYLAGTIAFVGDSLFRPEFGTARCDFPGGDAGELFDSIQKLYRLPAYTRLFLCHDYPEKGHVARCETTVAESRKANIHVRSETTRDEFIALREERDRSLPMPRLILPAIQVNIRAGHFPEAESNGVSYLRLPVDADLERLGRLPED